MKSILFLFVSILLFTSTLFAQNNKNIRQNHYNTSKGLAIQGYDPVAYFTLKKATEGKKEFIFMYEGVTYQFVSAENKKMFSEAPSKYEPLYGGWCAYAMGAVNDKVDIDPETFKIIDNRLYLFYNAFFNNTLKSWNKDEANLKMKADTNWKKIAK